MHTHIVMAVSDMLCVAVLCMEAALRLTDLKTSDSASNCFWGCDICLFLWLAQGVSTFHKAEASFPRPGAACLIFLKSVNLLRDSMEIESCIYLHAGLIV